MSYAVCNMEEIESKLKGKGKKGLVVTDKGKPAYAVIPWDVYESMVETLEVKSDPAMMEGVKRYRSGKEKLHSLESIKAEFGL